MTPRFRLVFRAKAALKNALRARCMCLTRIRRVAEGDYAPAPIDPDMRD